LNFARCFKMAQGTLNARPLVDFLRALALKNAATSDQALVIDQDGLGDLARVALPQGDGGGPSLTVPTADLLAGDGTALVGLTLGTGLERAGNTLNVTVTGGGPSLTVPTADLLAGDGTALVGLTLGTGLTRVGSTLNATAAAGGGGLILADNIAAAGNSTYNADPGNATELTTGAFNIVTWTANNYGPDPANPGRAGVRLPTPTAGAVLMLSNDSQQDLLIYSDNGSNTVRIGQRGPGASFFIESGATVYFFGRTATQWMQFP
jgi:hypothetical protein